MAKAKKPKECEAGEVQPQNQTGEQPQIEISPPNDDQPLNVATLTEEDIAEFMPYKHYKCSMWRTNEGNVFVKRAKTGSGGSGMKKVFSEGNFSFEASKKRMRMIITIDKPDNFNAFFEIVAKEVNKAILEFHRNKVIDLIK